MSYSCLNNYGLFNVRGLFFYRQKEWIMLLALECNIHNFKAVNFVLCSTVTHCGLTLISISIKNTLNQLAARVTLIKKITSGYRTFPGRIL